jgi:hypothetical protein
MPGFEVYRTGNITGGSNEPIGVVLKVTAPRKVAYKAP